VLLPAAPARAEAPPGSTIGRHLLESPELLGDMGGARSRLERLGIVLQLFYNQYLSGKPEGGGANPDGVFGHSGSYDLFARVDLEELVGWRGGDFLIHLKGMYDRNLNADVGAISAPIDDADYDDGFWVDELWLGQSFWDGRLRLRAGLLEHQTIFDRNAYANSEDRQFLTTFLDNNGVVPLPYGVGGAVFVAPTSWLEIALGAISVSDLPRRFGHESLEHIDSASGYVELRFASPLAGRGLEGHTRIGLFIDGREKTHFETGREKRGHVGAYLNFDQRVWRESETSPQGVGVFARAGYANRDYNALSWFWSLGGEWIGALPCRDADVLGFGVYQALGSSTFREQIDPRFEHETGFELYYRIAALPWLAITPDFQYILDPGATGTADDAFVVTLRLRVSF
jgi:porin